jgi:hypothetical protein
MQNDVAGDIMLVPVVTYLYFTLTHTTSVFSLPLVHYGSSSKLQLSAHSHINLLSPSPHNHSILNHFRIYFMDNKFKKIN